MHISVVLAHMGSAKNRAVKNNQEWEGSVFHMVERRRSRNAKNRAVQSMQEREGSVFYMVERGRSRSANIRRAVQSMQEGDDYVSHMVVGGPLGRSRSTMGWQPIRG